MCCCNNTIDKADEHPLIGSAICSIFARHSLTQYNNDWQFLYNRHFRDAKDSTYLIECVTVERIAVRVRRHSKKLICLMHDPANRAAVENVYI